MRIRHLVILVVVVLASSIIGQEEPLPAVVPIQSAQLPLVALAVEPAVDVAPPTLADAARNNDYATFHALYEKTQNAAYAPLHELWTYSVNDRVGAFYGPEMYERLSRAYPGFAAYIADSRIVDMRGNVFYPTSETRRFLLARAMEGVKVAERVTPRQKAPERSAGVNPRREASVLKPAPRAETAQPPAPAPRVEPAPIPEPVQIAEAIEPIIVTPPPVTDPVPAPVAPATAPGRNTLAGRGLLLVIVGLIGIGLLAMIMKTPGEQHTVVRPRRDP